MKQNEIERLREENLNLKVKLFKSEREKAEAIERENATSATNKQLMKRINSLAGQLEKSKKKCKNLKG